MIRQLTHQTKGRCEQLLQKRRLFDRKAENDNKRGERTCPARKSDMKMKRLNHTRKQKLLQERVQSTGQQIDGKKSRVPDKISKAFKDFLVGYKLKRDKLSVVKRNAVMWMIVKITGRYQATKQKATDSEESRLC